MKIDIAAVTRLQITQLEDLDPITVILENYEPGKGKIIIECFGESWANYWGAMAGRTIEQFFCDTGEAYLAGKLAPSLRSEVLDESALRKSAEGEVAKRRRAGDLTKEEARDLFEDCCYLEDGVSDNHDLLHRVFGDDWGYSLPEMPNHRYEYLCLIISAVKSALRELAGRAAA